MLCQSKRGSNQHHPLNGRAVIRLQQVRQVYPELLEWLMEVQTTNTCWTIC